MKTISKNKVNFFSLLSIFVIGFSVSSCKKQDVADISPLSDVIVDKQICITDFVATAEGYGQSVQTESAILKNYKWVNGETIKIKFLSGTIGAQNKVKKIASIWLNHANVKFQWVASGDNADIKISIASDGTNYVTNYGNGCRAYAQNQTTMHFGWMNTIADIGTGPSNTLIKPYTGGLTYDEWTYIAPLVLHEFGHALGLVHEHQSPSTPIVWNTNKVLQDCALPPINWNSAMVQANIFSKFTPTSSNYTNFDTKSVMLYSYPATWISNVDQVYGTLNGSSYINTPSNKDLSITDRIFMGQMYPFANTTVKSQLAAGETLNAGQYISSPDGRFRAEMQRDGKFLLKYMNGSAANPTLWQPYTLWNSGTTTGHHIYMQSQGKLVVYNSSNVAVWHSGTDGHPGAYLTIRNDGGLLIYQNGVKLWSSGTVNSYM